MSRFIREKWQNKRIESARVFPTKPGFFELAEHAETFARVHQAPGLDPPIQAVLGNEIAGSAGFDWAAHVLLEPVSEDSSVSPVTPFAV
jgi:hypothetical protein